MHFVSGSRSRGRCARRRLRSGPRPNILSGCCCAPKRRRHLPQFPDAIQRGALDELADWPLGRLDGEREDTVGQRQPREAQDHRPVTHFTGVATCTPALRCLLCRPRRSASAERCDWTDASSRAGHRFKPRQSPRPPHRHDAHRGRCKTASNHIQSKFFYYSSKIFVFSRLQLEFCPAIGSQ
jgi:hypothetical protein